MTKLLPDGPIDTLGLYAAIVATPETITAALGVAPVRGLAPATAVDHVVIAAAGELQTVGDAVAVLAASTATVPVIAHATEALPGYVGARSLVIVVSGGDQGGTNTTADAARAAAASVVIITPAGAEAAPVPRVLVGALVVQVLSVLEQLGHTAGVAGAATAAVLGLERRRAELSGDQSPAATLARRIGRTLPIVYGDDALTGVAARHWKRQFNLSAKVAAISAAQPEVAWEDASGWGQHGDMTRQVFTLVTLRHGETDADNGPGRVMAKVIEFLDEVVNDHHAVVGTGDTPLGVLLDLLFYGDLVTWHLAQELEIDPGPTAAVTTLATLA